MSTAARTPDQITAEIAETRNQLANTIDQLVYRVHPKTLANKQVASIKSKFVSADGSPKMDMILKVAGGLVGAVGLIVVLRKVVG